MTSQSAPKGQRYTIVSSDTHAGADVKGYKPYLESRYHEEFDAWSATYRDAWLDIDDGSDLKMGIASAEEKVNWDSQERVTELEAMGIAGEVVIPNTSPPFFPSGVIMAGNPKSRDEYEHRFAGLRAHNRWLVDFCSQLPGRRAGIAQIFLNDIDDAVAEVKWIKEAGLTGGILLPIVSPGDDLPPLYAPYYDPLWAACASLGVPVTQHAGSVGQPSADIQDGGAINYIEVLYNSQRSLWHLILGGVFERHPELMFVMTEQNCGWVPDRLAVLDAAYHQARTVGSIARGFMGPGLDSLSRTPTEFWRKNCYVGASFMTKPEAEVRHDIGIDRIMWGADYPHGEGTGPLTREALRNTFSEVPEEECRLMLGENAIEVYGFDRDALSAAAARIGPTVEEVRTPLDVVPRFPDDTRSFAFVEGGAEAKRRQGDHRDPRFI